MSRVIYVSGHFKPENEATVHVLDHGLLYGDGVFEGSAPTTAASSTRSTHRAAVSVRARHADRHPSLTFRACGPRRRNLPAE